MKLIFFNEYRARKEQDDEPDTCTHKQNTQAWNLQVKIEDKWPTLELQLRSLLSMFRTAKAAFWKCSFSSSKFFFLWRAESLDFFISSSISAEFRSISLWRRGESSNIIRGNRKLFCCSIGHILIKFPKNFANSKEENNRGEYRILLTACNVVKKGKNLSAECWKPVALKRW